MRWHQIAAAIQTVLRGGAVFDAVATRQAVDGLKNGQRRERKLLERLSPQELRVLVEVANGKTDKEIGAALTLQTKTVRHYLDSVFQKLGVNTRTQAGVLWTRYGEAFAQDYSRKSSAESPPGSKPW